MPIPATAISAEQLGARVGTPHAPVLFDVRRREAFAESGRVIAGARWRNHMLADEWGRTLDPAAEVVVCCVHGHNVSQIAAAKLRSLGLRTRFLEGGTEGFIAGGGPTVLRKAWLHDLDGRSSCWVTGENPKADRLACPWFIRRFLDPEAEIIYVEPKQVKDIADELGAVPFGIDGVTFGHDGGLCGFDAFLDHFGVEDESLRLMARIIRGADTAEFGLEAQCAGLSALGLGISALHDDDLAALNHGIALYDGLYAWARRAREEPGDRSSTRSAA